MSLKNLDQIDQKILMCLQKGIPIAADPFQQIADQVGGNIDESDVIRRIEKMKQDNIIRRMSGFFESVKLGYCSMLVAVRPKEGSFEEAAAFINQYKGITHNYERSHVFSIWFTIIAFNRPTLEKILDEIENCGYVQEMMRFSISEKYKINATFDLTQHGEGGCD